MFIEYSDPSTPGGQMPWKWIKKRKKNEEWKNGKVKNAKWKMKNNDEKKNQKNWKIEKWQPKRRQKLIRNQTKEWRMKNEN